MQNLLTLLTELDAEVILRWPVAKDWRNNTRSLPTNLDLLIINGEGTLHHSNNRPRVQQLTSLPTLATTRWGCPTALINSTIHDNDPAFYHDLLNFDYISCRDAASKSLIESYGLEATHYPDLSFLGPRDIGPHTAQYETLVTDSVLPTVTRTLKRFAQTRPQTIYMPMQPGKLPWTKKLPVAVRAPLKLATHLYATQLLNSDAFMRTLHNSEGLITGRFHAAAYAIMTRTPFIAIESNTPKISHLVNDVGLNISRVLRPEHVADIQTPPPFTEEEEKQIDNYLGFADAARKHLKNDISALLRASAS